MTDRYRGPVRIIGSDGVLLTVGSADVEPDSEKGGWRGLVQTLNGSAVSGKALVVEIEVPEGGRGRAQLVPQGVNGEMAISNVIGLGRWPFQVDSSTGAA